MLHYIRFHQNYGFEFLLKSTSEMLSMIFFYFFLSFIVIFISLIVLVLNYWLLFLLLGAKIVSPQSYLSSGPIFLDQLACTDSDTSLIECNRGGQILGITACDHMQDVWVECKGIFDIFYVCYQGFLAEIKSIYWCCNWNLNLSVILYRCRWMWFQ